MREGPLPLERERLSHNTYEAQFVHMTIHPGIVLEFLYTVYTCAFKFSQVHCGKSSVGGQVIHLLSLHLCLVERP